MHPRDQLTAALDGRYQIDRLIGEGGMATVYLADDVKHNRKVALKVLKPELVSSVGVERFLSEIRVTANLQHPNLLPLFDSGTAGELLFYVMPFVDGESLRDKLKREKQLPVDDAVRIAAQAASALDYAHRRGVIHRDLKPENILLHEGQPLVADFGIALALSSAGGHRLTQTGLSLGTPQYMSPEQATGERTIDGRSDIYSLGVVAYEMLTGEPPHTGATSQAIIAKVITEKPRSIRLTRPSVPPHVEAAIDHALQKLPPDRFATAKEFGEALTGVRPLVAPAAARLAGGEIRRGLRLSVREIVAFSVAALAIGFAVWRTVAQRGPAPSAATTRSLVEMPESVSVSQGGSNASVTLSDDGSTLVFQGQKNGVRALYLRRLNDRRVQLIRGTEGASRPILSPDGSEVLFHADNAFSRIPVVGGTPRKVAEAPGEGSASASWGSNHQIVYSIGRRLFISSDESETPRLLATPDSSRNHMSYAWPHILPGGKAALITIFVGGTTGEFARLGTVSLTDGRVTEFSPIIKGTNPRYSSTGHVVYVTYHEAAVVAAPFSVSALRVTGTPIRIAEGIWVGFNGAAAFSVGRGGTIAFRPMGDDNTPGRELVVVSRGGVATPLGARPGHYQGPRVSPNGRQVAVTDFVLGLNPDQVGPNSDIWRFDLGSKTLTRFTTDSVSFRPEWSADGERIAYVRYNDTTVMWRSLNANSAPAPVVRSSLVMSNFSLGRRHVAISASNNAVTTINDIFVSPIDSLVPPRPFQAERGFAESTPRLSPNERMIAYLTNRTGRDEVYVRAFLTDGPEVQVSSGGGSEPIWSRDGGELFYRVPGYMMSARITGGPRIEVKSDTLFPDVFLRAGRSINYDVFPDGKSFVMLRGINGRGNANQSAPLVVITNWRPDGNRRDDR